MREQTNDALPGQSQDLNEPNRDLPQTGEAGKGAQQRTPDNADPSISDEEMESFDDDPNIPTE